MKSTLIRGGALVALLGALALAPASHAQSPDGDDIQQTVLRVAYFSGEVSYLRGDDPDNWQPASLNFPMTLGDRLYTASGSRLELQTEGGAIYLAPETDLAALNLTYDVKQFSLGMGSASFRIRQLGSGETFEVDTPNAAVTFDRAGEYRINVDRDGNTRVIVNRGYAHVAAAGGEVPLDAGRLMAIDGIDSPVYDVTSLPRRDSWDQWVATRSRPSRDNGSRRYVNADISGADDLDQYGRWSQIPEYGSVWSPANVSADWQPYRAGRWAWQDPWGWSWVSNESWGWAPYHYGRWVTSQSRWYWVPVGPSVRTVRYAPALVAFVGGPGFSASVSVGGGGNVGWFPLAPRDPFVPWWGSRARETNVTNVTYVNRTYVTVVNQNTFISGAPVARNTIRDARVIREISAAPVVRGPIQIVPVASSLRVSTEKTGPAPHPPAVTLTRPVVTRLAPPPAPASFVQKESLIRENRGAPVQAAAAARLAPAPQAIRPTRSVVAEPGRVTLAPKNAGGGAPAPVPVTRANAPGQAPAAARELPPGQAKNAPAQQQQGLDAHKAQEADTARKAQEAEGARKAQQQQLDSRKAQEADTARKAQEAEGARKAQQQQLDSRKAQEADTARKAQEAEGARKAQQQQLDSRKAQEADTARKAQEAEGARKAQQQQLDSRKAQEADAARKAQQQQLDSRKAQEADTARKAQQQQLDSRKAQEADAARKAQQQQLDSRKAQEADTARKAQQQQLDSRKAQEADAARKAQQQQLDSRKAQEADTARKAQQQQLDSRKAQEADAARKAQQQQLDSRKAQEADTARKAQQQQLDSRKAQEADAARKAQQQQVDTRKAQEAAKAKAPDQKEQDKKDKEKKDQEKEKN